MKDSKLYTIGIDIGGTNMKAVLFDGQETLADYELATPKDNLDHFLIMVKALVEPILEKAKKEKIKVKGVGLSVAGVIDYEEKKMLKSPNISIIDGVKLAEEIENRIGRPVLMDNDANCFLRAEVKLGEAQKLKSVYGIIIGTGIGGAWWINDEIYRGSHGGAGEPGQMIINFTEPIGLEEAYQKLSQNNAAQLAEQAYRGDTLALKAWQEIGQYLGLAFANIVNLIDPEAIVIGGGASQASDLFLPAIKKSMKEHIMSAESKKIKVLKTKLGKHVGAIGAALLREQGT